MLKHLFYANLLEDDLMKISAVLQAVRTIHPNPDLHHQSPCLLQNCERRHDMYT